MKLCDVVMKGGVTSGVVYPSAIVELSSTYHFKNIGGTSAGAIAASVTAAAELGRRTGRGTGLTGLAQIPIELSHDHRLFKLFQPDAPTKPLFDIVCSALGSEAITTKLPRIVLRAASTFPGTTVASALPGLLLTAYIGFLAWPRHPDFRSQLIAALALIVSVLLTVCAPIVCVTLHVLRRLFLDVPENKYGLCSGHNPASNLTADKMPLTDWLAMTLDELAGMSGDKPLTFGDLWEAPIPPVDDYPDRTGDRRINLQMITTCLTYGHPYVLPFESQAFFFDDRQLGKLFPPKIMRWMTDPARRQADDDRNFHAQDGHQLFPLPVGRDLPVAIAARMSLAFPVLLSAVPLYAADYLDLDVDDATDQAGHPRDPNVGPVWFSDGGLTNNFPVRFFDAPLPRWPTFGIDLRENRKAIAKTSPPSGATPRDESANVWMPSSNRSGFAETWNRFDDLKGSSKMLGFFSAMFDATQNWEDNTIVRAPGYRDRIVHIGLNADEGGMNLNMPEERITALSERGACAGKLLLKHFSPQPGGIVQPSASATNGWDEHRWTRYRVYFARLERQLAEFLLEFGHALPPDSQFADLSASHERTSGKPYAWRSDLQREATDGVIAELTTLAARWPQSPHDFASGAPVAPRSIRELLE